MKKTFTFLTILLAGSLAYAQSQRLVMVEGFSQASCGPCASQNPALNAALSAAGTSTVVSIKYQTSWPGVDPMNAQNPTEVAARVSYYGISGVPDRILDGTNTDVDAAAISARYAVPSPFTLSINHVFNADRSAATVTAVITCTQAVTATGNMVLQVGLIEKEINFATAPGTNGEKDFYSVMRKMLPNANGTALAGSWTVGQTQTITLNVNTPSYIYDESEIAFVGWIQDNGGAKPVHQAGYSAPQPISTNVAVSAVSGVPLLQCATTFTPTITIKNTGTTTLTSGTINYQVDAGAASTLPWTGSLAAGATTTQVLPTVTSTVGSHVFKAFITNPNGSANFNTQFEEQNIIFSIVSTTGAASPIIQNYSAVAFPPAGWILSNPDNGPTWSRNSTAGANATAQSAKMDFYNSAAGSVDELYLPNANMTMTATQAALDFYVAYATYLTEQDKLEVKVSTDCGVTWTTPFSKVGTNLQTANPQTAAFTPTAAQWRAETVNMTPFINQTNVLVKFVATSAYGNNLYVDEINLHAGASLNSIKEIGSINSFEVFPNPFENQTTLNINTTKAERISFDVVDMLGNRVMTQDLGVVNGLYRQNIDATSWNAGIYFININSSEGGSITKKINVIK
jgi:hypothetical protein